MDVWGKNEQINESPRNGEYKEPAFLEVTDNKIYFYAEVHRDKVLQLNKKISELNNNLTRQKLQYDLNEDIPIHLYINSFGGSIFSGFSAMDHILKSRLPVITVVDGVCASAATFLSVVGTKRYITKHSYMLIHQLSSGCWGKFEDFKDTMKNLENFMVLIKNVYCKYTEIPEDKLEEILKHDIFFNADECLKYKLVDGIL
jgi:ATP-dependent Clp endopeptidase proteolytic subunit ClpP